MSLITNIKTSLIISTYNWKEALELVFISLQSQTEFPFEVIIADDGSRSDTKELIENFKKKFSFPLIHVWHKDKGFRLAEIRNKAIKQAKGDYIIQIDGDIILHKDFIKDHKKNARKGFFISGSRVLLGESISKRVLKTKEISFNYFSNDITNKHYTLRAPLITKLLASPSDDIQKVIRSIRGCNMSFWRSDLLRINGYNEEMVGWGREDSEISARLVNLGLKKTTLKFSGIQYHIFHPIQTKNSLSSNHSILEKTIKDKKAFVNKGISKSITESQNIRKLTAIIPVFNEAKNIKAAIKSVSFADEIIVIDSYSTDNTILIAESLGAKILQRKFDDFSSQKNYAISKATYDWVFILDADERLSKELENEIIATTFETETKDAYWMYRQNFFANKKVRYSGWQNDKVMRLFDRKLCKYTGFVHEEIENKGTSGYFKGEMLHYSCKSKQELKNKIEKYALLKSKELFIKKTKPNLFHFYIKPAYRFFYHYFLKLGILDGGNGLAIASVNAYGMKMRYRELDKLYRNEKTPIQKEVKNTINTLAKGQTILYPTDTVWGIGCDATNNEAIEKVFQIKKRNESKNLIVLVDSLQMLQDYVLEIPSKALEIIENNEKPTTIIYSNPNGLAKKVIADDNTIAIRIVQDSFCKQLIKQFGKPIVSTSANISTKSTPKNYAEIDVEIINNVDYIVDLHKQKQSNKSSSIIKIHKDGTAKILRE